MRLPYWLPYPKAWLHTIVLFFTTIPIYYLQYVLTQWVGVSFLVSARLFERQPVTSFFVGFCGVIFLVFPIFFLSHIHQLFWGNPHPKFPKFIPAPKSLIQGSIDWAFNLFGLIVAIVVWINVAKDYEEKSLPTFLIWALTITWFFAVAYLYHFWFFLGRCWKRVRLKFEKQGK
jgi:hypothetical protein